MITLNGQVAWDFPYGKVVELMVCVLLSIT